MSSVVGRVFVVYYGGCCCSSLVLVYNMTSSQPSPRLYPESWRKGVQYAVLLLCRTKQPLTYFAELYEYTCFLCLACIRGTLSLITGCRRSLTESEGVQKQDDVENSVVYSSNLSGYCTSWRPWTCSEVQRRTNENRNPQEATLHQVLCSLVS